MLLYLGLAIPATGPTFVSVIIEPEKGVAHSVKKEQRAVTAATNIRHKSAADLQGVGEPRPGRGSSGGYACP